MGYVYVVKMGDTNYHKVGITEKEPSKRLPLLMFSQKGLFVS